MYGYRMSKAAVNMATVSLARDWKDKYVSLLGGLLLVRCIQNLTPPLLVWRAGASLS